MARRPASEAARSPIPDRRPLYQAVAEALSRGIRQGAHPVGAMLPTEAELRERFGVSRQTVREAIRVLAQLGMVSRHHGVGTRVERADASERYVQRLERLPDLWQYVKDTRRRVLRVGDVPAGRAGLALPGDPAARWRAIEALRYVAAERTPIAWTVVYVAPAYAAVTRELARDVPVYSLVERRFGVRATRVRQQIAAVLIAGRTARLLRVPPGSVGLSLEREYFSTEGELFEASVSVHPADRFRYTMQLELDEASPRGPADAPRRALD